MHLEPISPLEYLHGAERPGDLQHNIGGRTTVTYLLILLEQYETCPRHDLRSPIDTNLDNNKQGLEEKGIPT